MKLHLPHSLRAALIASWAFMITSQASAATYTIDNASYSKVTPCCSEMGDWAFLSDVNATLSLYCYQPLHLRFAVGIYQSITFLYLYKNWVKSASSCILGLAPSLILKSHSAIASIKSI